MALTQTQRHLARDRRLGGGQNRTLILRCRSWQVLLALALFWASLVATSSSVFAASRGAVEVALEPRTVEIGDSFDYTIQASSEGNANIRLLSPPGLDRFQILGTSQAPQVSVQNGVAVRSLTLSYRVRATELGRFKIKPPVVQIGTERFEPQTLSVAVVERGKGPKPTPTQRNAQAFIESQLEPTRKPFVGEQVTLTYDLFLNNRIDGSPKPPSEPSLDAFWIEDLSDKFSGPKQLVRMGAHLLERIGIKKYALFPLRAGTTTIEPMSVTIVTRGIFQRGREVKVSSDPIKLEILPLPPNAPPSFAEGNVGQWEFSVTPTKRQVPKGGAFDIRIQVTGYGHLTRIQLPRVPEIEQARVIDQREESSSRTDGTRVGGQRTRIYTLLPEKVGTLHIPPLTFAYFDPKETRYVTRTSEAFDIKVTEASDSDPRVSLTPEPLRQQRRADEDDVINTLLDSLEQQPLDVGEQDQLSWRPSFLYWFFLGFPLLCCLGLMGVSFLQVRVPKTSEKGRSDARQAFREADEKLRAAERSTTAEACQYLSSAWKQALSHGLGLSTSRGANHHLSDALCQKGLTERDAQFVLQTLRICDELRYAPSGQAGLAGLDERIARSRALIKTLQQQNLPGSGWRFWSHLLLIALVPTLSTLAVQTALHAEPDATSKDSGVARDGSHQSDDVNTAPDATLEAKSGSPSSSSGDEPLQLLSDGEKQVTLALGLLKEGKWRESADLWEAFLAKNPEEPFFLYHASVAYAHLREFARARLLIERAVLKAPDHLHIQRNREVLQRIVRIRGVEASSQNQTLAGTSDALLFWELATRIPPQYFAWVLLATCWLLLVALSWVAFFKMTTWRDIGRVVAWLAFSIAVVAAAGWGARSAVLHFYDPVVVTAAQPQLREGPSEHAASIRSVFPVVAGTRLVAEERREGWIKVVLPDNTEAWLPHEQAEFIKMPRGSTK